MNKNKLLVLIILIIFCVGMTMGSATASHTFTKGKYSVKVSNKEYNIIKKNRHVTHTIKWTGKYKKTKKWVTKKVKTYESWINSNGYIYKSKSWNPYNTVGYNAKYVKSVWKYYSDGDICYDYYKVPKIVKKKVYMTVSYNNGHWYKTLWTRG